MVLPIHNLPDAIVVLTESPLKHQPSAAALVWALLLPPPHHNVARAVEGASRELRGNAHSRKRLLELCAAHKGQGRAGGQCAWCVGAGVRVAVGTNKVARGRRLPAC